MVLHEPVLPGCLVRAKPLALLQMQDEKGRDDTVLSVALGDPVYQDIQTFQALPPHIPREIEHFFTTHKFLEQ